MKIEGINCLVTGGAGFIGSHLVDLLVRRNCRVRVLDNFENGKPENLSAHATSGKVEIFRGSVTDPLDVARAVREVDVVFHLACLGVRHSLVHPFENHRVNAEGSLRMLESAHQANVRRFLYCSSSEVYGTAQYIPMPETHPTHPCTVYGAGKLAGEAYARAFYLTYGMPVVIVRPFNNYGPRSHHEGDAGEMIPKAIVRALNGRAILVFGDGTQTRDFTYVTDTVRALVGAAETDSLIGGTYNVGSGFEISIVALAEKIAALAGDTGTRVTLSEPRPGDVLRLFADSTVFVNATGWKPSVSFDEGLTRTMAYFREHPAGIEGLLESEEGQNWKGWET